MFLAPQLGVSVNTLILLVIAAYGAAAVGRFESLPGTVAGAMLLHAAVSTLAVTCYWSSASRYTGTFCSSGCFCTNDGQTGQHCMPPSQLQIFWCCGSTEFCGSYDSNLGQFGSGQCCQ